MTSQPAFCSAPFDAVAQRYDEVFTSSRIGLAQRAAVWKVLDKTFRPGERVLEIGCGTGVDACFMAGRGIRVVACDSSSEMIAVTTRRVREQGLEDFVQARVLRAEELRYKSETGFFDGAFSNFGVTNCLEDLDQFARNLASLLKPGATALLCWMGPCCLWEMLWYAAHGNREKAFRRLKGKCVNARVADGVFVKVDYPSVRFIARTFAPEFRIVRTTGIGLFVPPSYVETWARQHPRLLRFCERMDSVLRGFPGVRLLADHILIEFRRESVAR